MRFILLVLLAAFQIYAQTGDKELLRLEKRVKELNQKKLQYENKIEKINSEIDSLYLIMNKKEIAKRIAKGYYLMATENARLKNEASPFGDVLLTVPIGDTVLVLDSLKNYYRVSYNNRIGFISDMFLVIPAGMRYAENIGLRTANTNEPVNNIAEKKQTIKTQCIAITQAGTQCSRNAQEGSQYCWQHDKIYNSSSSSSTSDNSSRTIQTGPRGGKYYINKNGNKTYIRKKK